MKHLSIITLFILSAQFGLTQPAMEGMKRVFIQQYGQGIFSRISEIPARPPDGPVGSSLMHEEWMIGNVYLKSKEKIVDYPLRYDALHQWIEIQVEGEVKILPVNKIEGFEWKDPTDSYFIPFINAEEYEIEGKPGLGIFEILSFNEKGFSAFAMRKIEVIPADYKPQYNAGSREDKITQKEKLYFVDTANKQVFKIKKSKKKNMGYMGGHEDEMSRFIKKNKLSFEKKADLIKIVEKLNEM